MIKDIEITLYEIFGYLIPGAFFGLGLTILYWTLYEPSFVCKFVSLSNQEVVLFVFAFYMIGHVAQSVGNNVTIVLSLVKFKKPAWLSSTFKSVEWVVLSEKLSPKDASRNYPSGYEQNG